MKLPHYQCCCPHLPFERAVPSIGANLVVTARNRWWRWAGSMASKASTRSAPDLFRNPHHVPAFTKAASSAARSSSVV